MKSLWCAREAAAHATPLAQRVYSSRLLGRDRSLVLHGGGNTSAKLKPTNVLGEEEDVLYVKGSGWDLETIEAPGFAPVRLDYLIRLSQLDRLSDTDMVNELLAQRLVASAPAPSVEAILHAILPYRYVDHTHADAVLAVCNTRDGRKRMEEIYAEEAVIIPYVMPGFDLAKLCAREFPRQRNARTKGMILLNHGVFSFGETAHEAYERMIELVDRAERYLKRARAWTLPKSKERSTAPLLEPISKLRRTISEQAGVPMLLHTRQTPAALAYCRRPDIDTLAGQGPATPDHSIRTKRLPMIGLDVERYARDYAKYFASNVRRAKDSKSMLDPAPRVVLDRELGLCTAGRSARDTAIVAEIYEHTIEVVLRATALGGYRALSARDIFDVEYWELEQAKLKLAGKPAPFAGEIALVTGGASGIGRACVEALLAQGAAVVALDLDGSIESMYARPEFLGIACDVTSNPSVHEALERAVRRFGGLDMLVLNAGMFPGGMPIQKQPAAEWRRVMSVNLDANQALMQACHPLLRQAPRHGRVVVIGSKNVRAPGIGAAAYSASKAALTQLARVAALEWAADGIRVNVVHPDAVFDTGLWTPKVLQARAAHYGMTVEQYRTRNLLRTEVRSRDVAAMVCAMCSEIFGRTTGAQVPVDGGNDRVI